MEYENGGVRPMERVNDLARVKDVNAVKVLVAAYRREADQFHAASEVSHQAMLRFIGDALKGVDDRLTANEKWYAAIHNADMQTLKVLQRRIYTLEHPWRARWARVQLAWYEREARFWGWLARRLGSAS